MTAADPGLTKTDIIAAVTDILTSEALGNQAYVAIGEDLRGKWPTESVRLFEDRYGIVAVVVYDTWAELSSGWPEAQGALVTIISKHVSQAEPKAWDGYLVLMTTGPMAAQDSAIAAQIRYDVHRVRKLLATGDDMRTVADVRRVLLPLLPLESVLQLADAESVLDLLPELLSTKNIEPGAVEALISAFLEQQPLVEALHDQRIGP